MPLDFGGDSQNIWFGGCSRKIHSTQLRILEGTTMDHFNRLQLAARVTYYLGWISLLLGGLIHFNVGRSFFVALNLSKRNLFEVSVVLFVICLASGVRAFIAADKQVPVAGKRVAA
jgi:hypothetical protein